MKKRVLAFVLALGMALSLLTVPAGAAATGEEVLPATGGDCGADGNNVTWNIDLNEGTANYGTLYIRGSGAMADYEPNQAPWYSLYHGQIKRVVIENGVTSIGKDAFDACTVLESVTIPNSVTSIGEEAFDGCYALTSVDIPNSVTSIGTFAFRACRSLTSIIIPDKVTSLAPGLFSSCASLTSVTIPNSVTSIERGVFNGCGSLTSVTIPNSVTSIGENAFYSCTGLTSVTIRDRVTSIGNYAFNGCTNLETVYYGGAESQWNAISIGTNNEPLLNAAKVYMGAEAAAPIGNRTLVTNISEDWAELVITLEIPEDEGVTFDPAKAANRDNYNFTMPEGLTLDDIIVSDNQNQVNFCFTHTVRQGGSLTLEFDHANITKDGKIPLNDRWDYLAAAMRRKR